MMRKIFLSLLICFGSLCALRAQHFEKISNNTNAKTLSSRTAGLIDIDQDGLIDLFISNGDNSATEIYLNEGEGVFSQFSDDGLKSVRIPAVGANIVDIENDDDLDIYITSWGSNARNFLLTKESEGYFVQESNSMSLISFSEAAGWADYNGDGYLDAILANSASTNNIRYTSNGDGTFQKSVYQNTTEDSRCVSWADFDNDGDQDLFITNEQSAPYFYLNDNGSLIKQNDLFEENYSAFGGSWGDFDNDGDLDLFLARFGPANVLLENENGVLTELTNSGLSVNEYSSIGSSWGDIDNDGDLDLIVTNGYGSEDLPIELYINNGDKTFTEVINEDIVTTLGSYYGVAFGDYDEDGYLDVLIANVEGSNGLYNNLGSGNNWVHLDLKGTVSNRDAIGARVYLYQSSGETVLKQTREVASNSGYSSLNDMRVHFGLGALSSIDSIEIQWPENHKQTLYSPAINQTIEVVEVIPEAYLQSHFIIDGELISESSITFVNNAKYDDSFELSYEWDFDGDNTIDSQEESPSHTYQESGVYTVSLKVSNSVGSSTYEREIEIEEVFGINEVQTKVAVYPNPSFSGNFSITSKEPLKSVAIWDLAGNLLFESKDLRGSNLALDLGYSGVILVESVLQSGTKETHKAVIGIK